MNDDWTELFEPAASSSRSVSLCWRVLKRQRQPFLVLPGNARLAERSLSIYQPQSSFARVARAFLHGALRLSLPIAGEKVRLAISDSDPLLMFLAKLTNMPVGRLSAPAILAGNPRTKGRRFILLAFDENEEPAAVLKVGMSTVARQLIQREAAFLAALPANLPGAPGMRGSFQSAQISVLAQDFFAGDSPRVFDQRQVGNLLGSWIITGKSISLDGIPAWQRLAGACQSSAVFRKLSGQLGDRTFHSAIYHGDFAPWNVKVVGKTGEWKVLDWERGESVGIPGWDWFHFVIQHGILARGLPADRLVGEVESLLGCNPFLAYAIAAAITGMERHLVLGYLLHQIEIIRPSEGLDGATQLLNSLLARWA